MNDTSRKVCQQPGCGGPESGVCIENFPFEECPHLILLRDELPGENYAVPEGGLETATGDYVPTSPGATLDSAACDALLRKRDALVLAVIAGPEAGKTTLLATIYELSRRGKMEQVEFAGSDTILGFEERCHLSRANSMLEVPDTQRTRVKGPRFLHLRLRVEEEYVDLLMADRPGENYTKAIETPAVLRDYDEVRRADHLLLLVDGKQLSANPHLAIAGARRLLRGLLDNGLRAGQQIHLVVTKVDLFEGESLNNLRAIAEELSREFQGRVTPNVVHLRMTGARARTGEDSFGEGVDTLVRGLVSKQEERRFQAWTPSTEVTNSSMLNRLMRGMATKR